jgi:hypothetical protein
MGDFPLMGDFAAWNESDTNPRGRPPVAVRPEDRPAYVRSLQIAQTGHGTESFERLPYERLDVALADRCPTATRGHGRRRRYARSWSAQADHPWLAVPNSRNPLMVSLRLPGRRRPTVPRPQHFFPALR